MSELFDDDPAAAPPPRPSRRAKILIGSVVVLIALFFAVTTFASLYTDGLWFGSVGFESVFWRMFWTKTGLFLSCFALMFLSLMASMVVAFRSRPFYHPADEHGGLVRYREAVNPIRGWLMVGICTIAGAFAGVAGASHWKSFLLWWHSVPFNQQDAYFHKDIGFYVFVLPWWHFVVNLLLAAAILALLASLAVHYLYGGIRLSPARERFSVSAQIQLSVLFGLCLLIKGVDYWLDRYDLVHDGGPLFTGVGYTDDHAVLPGKNILAGIAVICAVLFFVNAWRRTWLMPSVGVVLMLGSAILLGLIWPAIVQGFQVKPSQSEKEQGYVAANIAATRSAYQIDDAHVKVEKYNNDLQPGVTPAALDADASSVPLMDPSEAQREVEETQKGKPYYAVNSPLSVDHYVIDGHDRALDLGVRELDQSNLGAGDQNWTSLHAVYTHGDGVIAAYGNQRDATNKTEHSQTQYAESNHDHALAQATGGYENRVYFGEDSPDYSIVGQPAGAAPVEVNTAQDGKQGTTTYDGTGGVPIASTFRRFLYAVKFGSADVLLSDHVNGSSKVLDNRTPQERVSQVAPWLTLDNDVYPVMADGRLLWVLDGYTTTDLYPDSERDSLGAMTADATTPTPPQTIPTDQINYMRDAVKATVDAYDGTVTLYAWDPSDPILQAWESAFPGTVQPRSAMPPAVEEHLRYPDDLYKVQRYQLARYHETSPAAFLQATDRWDVPTDPTSAPSDPHPQTPYRMFVDAPAAAGGRPEWSVSSTFVPYERQNLAAIMTVDSDPMNQDYGVIRLLEGFGQETDGPGLVAGAFKKDPKVSAATSSYNQNYVPLPGNVLTVPTADHGLLYIQPLYQLPPTSSDAAPVLAHVLVSYDNKIGVGATLRAALDSALVQKHPGTPSHQGGRHGGRQTRDQRAAALLAQANRLFIRSDAAGRRADYSTREMLLAEARAKVARAAALLASSTPSKSPSPSSTSPSPSGSPTA